MSTDNSRSGRLAKLFSQVLQGKRAVKNKNDVKLFLEAVLEQKNHSACVEGIIGSTSALNTLQSGLRFDISPDFINKTTAPFIRYLSDPAVKLLCNGQFLQDLLVVIVEPRTLWNAFVEAFKNRALDENAIYAFAWMLMELLSLPPSNQIDVIADAKNAVDDGSLLTSSSLEIRTLGHKIKTLLLIKASDTSIDPDFSPGGRHDNDLVDFRKIAIYPTSDEFVSTEKPFYRRAHEVSDLAPETRIAAHLDNQFRLLREDMLSELRNDIQTVQGLKNGRLRAFILRNLSLNSIDCGNYNRRKQCLLLFRCESGLEKLTSIVKKTDRRDFLKENGNYLKHRSYGCLMRQGEIVSFATVDRDIDKLASDPPVIALQIADEALKKTLLYLKMFKDVEFLLVNTPFFAYEPILKCLQETMDLTLAEELLFSQQGKQLALSDLAPPSLIEDLCENGSGNIQDVLGTSKPVTLDSSQLQSLIAGLTQRLSLIQGPPGTGKSFIGALLAKALHDHTKETILVLCNTNHALDQFLEDLIDIGIEERAIVRLGSKYTNRTHPLLLSQQKALYTRSRNTWNAIDKHKADAYNIEQSLMKDFKNYQDFNVSNRDLLDFLQFEDPVFYNAFKVSQDNGMAFVGGYGKELTSESLINDWKKGKKLKAFVKILSNDARRVWDMNHEIRLDHIRRWTNILLEEKVINIHGHAQRYNQCQHRLESLSNKRILTILKLKRIIGCTTTAAAMYAHDLRSVSPGIVLLEEAGEILESHVLTAMNSKTKQLILIGDHKQLRPKIDNYALTVEKGDGYDLNRSLFERLVLAGYPHTTLSKQHRMCPEISALIKRLTYPDLQDDPKTMNHPFPRGLQDRVIFIDHEHPEDNFMEISDRCNEGAKGSKKNLFEVEIVLKIVRYLGQQGYGTDKLVVLTPYLGQLQLLRECLSKENDPVLNDLDSYDLVKAGLLTQASAKHSKRKICISTIDNYQGEESDIVIATLTRSNRAGNIGFMAAPQRLNVLLSRARNTLIMLKEEGHLYDGLPVKCEQHPDRTAILQTKEDFDTECPDGGCSAPCGVKLSCGVHECPQKCHQLSDHSKMRCYKIVKWICNRGHQASMPCFQADGLCRTCDTEDRAKELRRQRDLKLDQEREKRKREHAQKLTELQDKIEYERRIQKEQFENEERERVIQQLRDDLARLKKRNNLSYPKSEKSHHPASRTVSRNGDMTGETGSPGADTQQPNANDTRGFKHISTARDEWGKQKEFEGAQNDEIDALMEMIGLEDVKKKFLDIKDRVDTAIRQKIDLKDERFGSVLVGNPGTGKTTVARLYAKFLASVGVLPGSCFVETTGSRLANEGISGCQKQIENLLNSGGGALFIDEAYQLTGENSYRAQVLDFLLAEVENLTGKVVVILAGYRSHMEKFFAHNPGLPSRFPHEYKFNDYEDHELRQILEYKITKKYKGEMQVEGGLGGLYCRIVARRVGYGRGKEGFGNARAVENTFSRICERQSKRLAKERREKKSVNDMLLTREDLIGPEPKQVLETCPSWRKMQTMIGLSAVKKNVRALLDSIQYNYQRELKEKPLMEFTLNRVFLGSPGTGKTTVAKLYGQILADIGLLSNGEVIVKNPADFIGSYIGHSERNTKGILVSTIGKVLVIDEAYGLYGGGKSKDSGSNGDIFRTAVVDTIVAEVQSTPGDDRCVLLLGYKEQMEEMFQNVNPGLSRRFPLDSAFVFEDFTDDEIGQVFDLKIKQQGLDTTGQGRKVALEVLGRARNKPNFGNAGEVDILLNLAKMRFQQRLSTENSLTSILQPQDFDEDFDRGVRTETNIRALFDGVVGCEDIITQLEGYRQTVRSMRQLDIDPREQVPFNFLFRGPPGTGKTTTARKMGKVYYDMGLLSNASVVDCSATDLIGQYIGQTGPKTQQLLEKALGKVLFIDEAYRLADGHFAKEAMDEIVDCITKPKFAQKLIIILAGYDADINRLMSINPGLTSRFPESVEFKGLAPDDCIKLLTELLLKQKKKIQGKQIEFDMGVLEAPDADFSRELRHRFGALSRSPSWANARDVDYLARSIFRKTIECISQGKITVDRTVIITEMDAMINDRMHRAAFTQNKYVANSNQQQVTADLDTTIATPAATKASTTITKTDDSSETPKSPDLNLHDSRDSGVADDVWQQLELDKKAAEEREKEYKQLVAQERAVQDAIDTAKKMEADTATEAADAENKQADDEAKKRHEQERLRHELERRAQEEKLEQLMKKREAEEQRRRKEQEAQKKLRQMGVCPAGFRWIKQANGYRCAGGSHFVPNGQLGI